MATIFPEELEALVRECDKKTLAVWAGDVAARILPQFEKEFPSDERPRIALITLREWIKTGEFHMAVIRKASLDAHAAAREVEENSAARFAARACGQAVATAHVKTHALGTSFYAIKAIKLSSSEKDITNECAWQYQHLMELEKKL